MGVLDDEGLDADQWAMVVANLGLVGHVASRHLRVPPDRFDDALQDGTLGLARAVQKFDPSKGFTFSTYAVHWIRQAIVRGREMAEGGNFRHAGAADYQPPVSLSVDRTTDYGTVTLLDMLPATGAPVDEIAGTKALGQDLETALYSVCEDVIDRALADRILAADGEHADRWTYKPVADQYRRTEYGMCLRLQRLRSRLAVKVGHDYRAPSRRVRAAA